MIKVEPPNDIEIIRAQKNDSKSLRIVIEKTSPYVLNLCNCWCRPPLEGEDVAQETLITIAKKLNSYKSQSAYFTWVYSVTYRTFLDALRKQSRRNKIAKIENLDQVNDNNIAFDVSTENQNDNSQMSEILTKALANMHDDHVQILILIDVKQEPYAKTASDLGLPIGTVRSRLARARLALKKEINNLGTNSQIDDVLNGEEIK